MFAAVQPDTLQLCQGRTNGRRANTALRQICAKAGDQVGAGVGVIHRATDIHHHTLRIGQDGKVTGIDDGATQVFEHRFGSFNQLVVGIQGMAQLLRRDLVEHHRLLSPQTLVQAALPGPYHPGRHPWQGQR